MSFIEYVTSGHHSNDSRQELARANQFTAADLAANRQGRISGTQWRRLLLRAVEPVQYAGAALGGWLLFCLVVDTFVPRIVLMIAAMIGGKAVGAIFGLVTLTCVCAFAASLYRSGRSVLLLASDLRAGVEASIEGRVSPSREDKEGLGLERLYGEKRRSCRYVIRDEAFEVDEVALSALPDRGQFRLYYTPKSKLLLSIEPK